MREQHFDASWASWDGELANGVGLNQAHIDGEA
jgi:hypothetical protein